MKYLALIRAGLARRKVRTVLTGFSITIAFLLFGVLHSVTSSLDRVVDNMSDTRLRTLSSTNILDPLPLAYRQQIESLPGVRSVSHYTIFFGYYQDPDNGIGVGAIDAATFVGALPELKLSEDALEAMLRTRDGALAGAELAAEHGWEVGDRIPVSSRRWKQANGSSDWSFEIVGIYESSEDSFPSNELWINFDYLDEARADQKGMVNMYMETIDDARDADTVIASLDALFRNSPYETETTTEKDFVRSQIDQIGDLGFLMNAIIGAVLFTLVFVTGNTMMQAVRERIPEFAVLKTYGFTDPVIAGLVWAEALILCGLPALLGLVIARFVFPGLFASIGAPALPMPNSVILQGLGLALLLAVVSALLPIWRAHRSNLVDALAGR